jgi:hypothetical protein
MQASRRRLFSLLCGIAVGLTAACGGTDSASMSPVAPSIAPAPSGPGASISGRVGGLTAASVAAASAAGVLDIVRPMETRSVTVSIVGTSVSTTTDGGGNFTLTNVPAGTVQLNFSAPGSSAVVTISGVGPDDHVQIVVTLNGNNARLESEQHSKPDSNGEFVGLITSVDVAARSFKMLDTTVKVPTTATIRHGSQVVLFASLKVGDHVQVRGTRDGSMITASEVKVESGDQGDNNQGDDKQGDGKDGKGDSSSTDLTGTISALGGTCPVVNFMLQATKVTTSSATVYEGGSCATLKNTGRVEVRGTKAADGSIAATKISVEEIKDSSTTELKGTISALGGGPCPSVNFMLQATKVTTSGATTYEGGSCATLKNTLRVELKGTKGADGTVAATRISIDD